MHVFFDMFFSTIGGAVAGRACELRRFGTYGAPLKTSDRRSHLQFFECKKAMVGLRGAIET